MTHQMISFRPTEEEASFVDVAKHFANDYIRPQARACEEARTIQPAVVKKFTELGFHALELPEAFAGLELPAVSQVQVLEALACGDLAAVQGFPGPGDAASFFRSAPDSPAYQAYKAHARTSTPGTTAFVDISEPENAWEHDATVQRSENGFVIHGSLPPARLAETAEHVVLAAFDSELSRVVLFLSKAQTPWTVEKGDVRLGLLASGLGRIRFDHAEVPPDCAIAVGRDAFDLLEAAGARIRVFEAAKEVGAMRAALEYATSYSAQRKAFGREIAHFQGVSFLVAEMAIQLQATRNLTWRAAVALDENDSDAAVYARTALMQAHAAVRFVTDNAVQVLGGSGYVQEYPVEKWMRDAQAQVMLYGRERELSSGLGTRLLAAGRDEA